MATPKPNLSRDFKDLLKCFHSHDVKFLVVGGHAVSFHGFPRFTKDLDLWIERSPENAARITAALAEFGIDIPAGSERSFVEPGRMASFGREPMRVDILNEIQGVRFEDCHPQRQMIEVDGVPLPLISKADLIVNKRATGRTRDLGDAEELES